MFTNECSMHEFTLTTNIVEEVITALANEGNCKVIDVTLGFGPFTHGTFESIKFWWDILSKDTILEGSKLIFNSLPGELYCPACETIIEVRNVDKIENDGFLEIFSCPKCRSLQTEIKTGNEIIIIDVQII
jgi:hydrogenase nickel incorporation protein HypA/HybF